jgi:hypothetical protein
MSVVVIENPNLQYQGLYAQETLLGGRLSPINRKSPDNYSMTLYPLKFQDLCFFLFLQDIHFTYIFVGQVLHLL